MIFYHHILLKNDIVQLDGYWMFTIKNITTLFSWEDNHKITKANYLYSEFLNEIQATKAIETTKKVQQ